MTATNHVVTGALVAAYIHTPVIAIPLAFAMHFAMDAIPHFRITAKDDMDRFNKTAFRNLLLADMTLASLLLIVVPIALSGIVAWWLVLICMLACASPDLVWGWRFYKAIYKKQVRKKSLFSSFHTVIQWSETQSGIYVELVWFLLTSLLIMLKASP
jgi:hypothetical protein